MSVSQIEGTSSVVELKKIMPAERVHGGKSGLQDNESVVMDKVANFEKVSVDNKSNDELKKQVEEINYKLKIENRHCEFRYVEEANRVAIKVVDTDSDEIIKEIPSEEALKTMQILREMTGLLIDEQL